MRCSLTWLRIEWTTHGELNRQNGVCVPMADTVAAAVKRAHVVHDGAGSNKVPRRRSSCDEIDGVAGIQVLLVMALLLGRIWSLSVRESRRRIVLRWLLHIRGRGRPDRNACLLLRRMVLLLLLLMHLLRRLALVRRRSGGGRRIVLLGRRLMRLGRRGRLAGRRRLV